VSRRPVLNGRIWRSETRKSCCGLEIIVRRENLDTTRAREKVAGSTPKTRKGSVKLDEFKSEQQKLGKQLLASGSKYESHRLKELPAELHEKIDLRKIKDMGLLVMDKAVTELKTQKALEKHARRTTVPLVMDR
jgi:hypothetical protein